MDERTWHRSSYSGSDGDACVEVAACPVAVHVRDSKALQGPQLALSPAAWRRFVAYATDDASSARGTR
ncbi:DUF397 domain-containing protein [Streptomyces sp. TRM 70351]|uniref:DUF397 domain-containing protein n=1 Tax=Streptomyces sp. TRM 70351 TaxID=3116552 RepID=UPI002E7B439B|nr:DUF397 domain-containing protein [Streptomyces sp. TRM 70351]MEE1928305.1 DUF397 domain-containing protein [Streptomyces sp. TRM 70351]